ncbi:retention module-containing protein [Thauera sp. JM12B12]|uniref:retention module-containing protein n=1 Tax=Thauera sp. JM12B12 TaxID=3142262 RepID=UPI0031F3DE0D
MAEPRVVATVVRIDGQVFARNADGEVRILKEGDSLREGEVVITAEGGRVELAYADGGSTSIPADSSVLITEEMTEATRPDARAAAVEDATIAQVIQAIETGQDLEQVLEDPAAGLAGGGGGEGSNFVRLLRISEGVDGAEFAFDGARTAAVAEFDDATALAGATEDDATPLPEPIELSLTLVAPPLTNDNTPTITGNTDAPAGSQVTVVITDAAGVSQTVVATVDAQGGFQVTPVTPLADGPYVVTATVDDGAGNTADGRANGTVDATVAAPTIVLDDDTGFSSSDAITSSGAYTVSGTESGAVVEYSTDGGTTWSTTAPTAVEGENTIQVRQTDVAGNVSAPATLSFTLDTQIAAPTIALDTDTGASTTDGITKTGAYTVSGTETGAVIEYSTDGGTTWSTTAPTAVEGENTIQVRQTDVAGNVSPAATLSFTLDTAIAAPTIALDTDTGASGTDGITKTGAYTVSGTETGAVIEYSTDGGTTWSTTAPTAVEGANTIQVRQTDVAGNVSPAATLSFTLDTQIAAPTIALDTDTGASATDGITKTGTYTVTGTEPGAVVEYSTDGGTTWSTTAPTAVEGANTIQVRQTDVAGNVSAPATLSFTLDTQIAAPTIVLDADTGASGTDGITKTGAYTVSGTETGALVEYSTDGVNWSTTAPTAVEGANTIQVRQTDVAGNVSAPATLSFTLDTAIAAPTIALDTDTGASGTDGITKTGTYTVTGTETGAVVEYSTDGGASWSTTAPTAVEGANTIQVRQTDVAGNVSPAATLSFTLDTQIAAPTIVLDTDTGASTTDGITKTGAYTVSGTETGAVVEYSADGGTTWSTTAPTAVEGANTIQVRQTDVAGNVSPAATLSFTLDTQIAAPTIALDADTGASATDGITKTGTYTVTGTESGAVVEYSTDGGTTWSTTAPVAVEGENTIQVRQTDVAGNVSPAATLSFTLDTQIAAPTIALDADTGASGTDGITKTGAYTVSGTETGAVVEYSTDGGSTWSTTAPVAVEGENTIQVRQTDVAGNVSAPATLSFTLDTTIASPTIALDADTGASATDGITKTGAYTVSGTETGALVEYSTDGVNWSTTAPTAVEGANTIQVRQTDVAGNVSAPATLSFTLDTQIAAPTIVLDADTGGSATDGITKTGTYTVTGTETGAVVEYSTDGVNWSTTAPTAVEGANTIQVRQTDVAGNVSAPATLSFTLDTAIAAPTIALDTDTGASGTDGITKTGTYTVTGTETGAVVEYSTDGGASWSTTAPTAVEGANTIQVRQTDVAGNVSPAATLSFTLDTQIAAPTIVLDTDTGASTTDGITKTGAYTVSGTETGAVVEYSADGGTTWSTTAPTAVEGANTIQVRQTDVAGNVSPAATLSFTLDTQIAAPTIALDADTGASATDGITKTGTYTVTGTESGAVVEYSTDGGTTWSTTAPVAVEGENTIQVRQTDVAGNVSPAATLSFTLDTQIAAPTIALDADTGASGTDGITKTGAYTVSGTETGAVVEYSTDGGSTWSTTAPVAVEGENTIQVRQTDVAGNVSAPATLSFTLDTTIAAPTISLDADTGASGTDGITKTGTYTVTGTESGAVVEYSTDGGASWSTTAPTAVEGANTIQVRQTDVAGNVSAPATLSFTLDTAIAAPTIVLDTDTGASGTDGITKTGTYTVTGIESGALVEYSTDGVNWSTTAPVAVEGANTIQVRQTDVAGNVSPAATLSFTLDTQIAAPTIVLDADTGASATDGITKTGAYTVSGTETGAVVEYSTDGGSTWSTTAPVAVEGENTIQVRQTDVAGNVSPAATLSFTLDTQIAAPTIVLDADTGASATDGITKTGAYTVSGTETGAVIEYSTDGGTTWSTTAPTAVEGANTIQVRQTDVAGNVSPAATLSFTLDTQIAAPTIVLDADTGASGTDGITKTGAYTVSGTETGAVVEYSADGVNWSTTAPVAVEGENTIQVRQTDVAGNVSAPATLSFTLDTAIAAPTIVLDTDTGASGTDGITKTGTYTVTGTEPGAVVEYSTDGGASWSTTAPTAVEGANTIQVRQTDVAGNVSAPATLSFTLDTQIAAPTIALDTDTGASGTDGITKTGAYTVSGTETGAVVEYSADGVNWSTTAPVAVEGENTIQVRQTDVAGNVSAPATLSFTLDTAIAAPTIALDADTGASGTDGITKTGAYTVSGTETGAVVEYSTDGVNWSTTAPVAVEGENTIQVRQTDVAGNVSAPATLSFTLDTAIAAPTIALDADTGASGTDGITKTGTYAVTGIESGAVVEYSTDGGTTWSTTAPTAVEGENTIQVRQTDVAGNVSAPATLSFTLDTAIAAPTIALDADTGASGTDGITKTGAYTVSGTETGAVVEYSTDGVNWSTTAPVAVEGENTIQVRQTDVAGNVSAPATLSFTLDTQIAAPTIALDTDTGASATDGITKTGTYTVTGTETGALVEYSTDGVNWSTTAPTAVEGANTIQVRQTDVAGNVSAPATLSFTLDTAAPSVAITSADATLAANEASTVTFSFSDPVSGFEVVDVSTTGGVLSNLTQVDARTWTATFTANGLAPIAVSVAQSSYSDLAGNLGAGAALDINSPPVVPLAPLLATLSEEGLLGGNLGGGTTDATVASGRFDLAQVRDADGDTLTYGWAQPTGVLTSAGQAITWSGVGTGVLVGTAAGREVLRATFEQDGTYRIELLDQLDHPAAGEDVLLAKFGVAVSDGLASAVMGIDLRVEDDAPVFGTPQSLFATIEAGLPLSGQLNLAPGADGDGAEITGVQLQVDAAGFIQATYVDPFTGVTRSGPVTVNNGDKLTYTIENGVVTAKTAAGETAFTLSFDLQSSSYTLNVLMKLDPAAAIGYGSLEPTTGGNKDVVEFRNDDLPNLKMVATGLGGPVNYSANEIWIAGGNKISAGETLRLDFKDPASGQPRMLDEIVIGTTGTAQWVAYLSGQVVGQGVGQSSAQTTISADAIGSTFDRVELIGTASGYAVKSVSGDYLDPTVDFRIPVTVSVEDGDGDAASASMTIGFSADHVLAGTAADESIGGTAGADALDGGSGNDTLFGHAGIDTLRGGDGNDILVGGAGNDQLWGGLGADVFTWKLGDQGTTSAPATDTVKDFSLTQGDALDLRDLLADASGSLSNYLHFSYETASNTTVLEVKTDGAAMSGPDQIIRVEGVNLLNGLTDDQLIIQNLVNNGKLITE